MVLHAAQHISWWAVWSVYFSPASCSWMRWNFWVANCWSAWAILPSQFLSTPQCRGCRTVLVELRKHGPLMELRWCMDQLDKCFTRRPAPATTNPIHEQWVVLTFAQTVLRDFKHVFYAAGLDNSPQVTLLPQVHQASHWPICSPVFLIQPPTLNYTSQFYGVNS